MSEFTPRLSLPLIGDHSQKRLVLNDALMRLDSLLQVQVLSSTLTAQPTDPMDGDCYILPAGCSGDVWGGLSVGTCMRSEGGTWEAIHFPQGAIIHIRDENAFFIMTDAGWGLLDDTIHVLKNMQGVGIGTEADGYNILAVKGAAALLTALSGSEGGSGNISLTLNKETDDNTAQILLQKTYSTRAALGLLGDNNLTLKVSPDGAAWSNVLVVNNSNGSVGMGNSAPFASDDVLHMRDTRSAYPTILLENTTDDASSSYWYSRKARNGTSTLSGDILGTFSFQGMTTLGTPATAAQLYFYAPSAPNATGIPSAMSVQVTNASGVLQWSMGISSEGIATFPQTPTTASASNAYLDGSNNLYKSTSSALYKKDIEAIQPERAYNLMAVQAKWYRSTAQVDDPLHSWYGFLAEDVAAIDPRLVTWVYPDAAYETRNIQITPPSEHAPASYRRDRVLIHPDMPKRPDGVAYERFTVVHQQVLQDLLRRVEALEARV
ncbi:MAG: DUF2793 domain-containing protein [Asticcacaulis sp.]